MDPCKRSREETRCKKMGATKGELLVRGGKVFREGRLEQADLYIRNGLIDRIWTGDGVQDGSHATEIVPMLNVEGRVVVPGFIDTHIHGIAGREVNRATPDDLRCIARALARQGVTSWLCSVLPDTEEAILKTIDAAIAVIAGPDPLGARLLGIHLEGPFVSAARCGALDAGSLRQPDIALADRFIRRAGGHLLSMTIAPELPGAIELIAHLHSRGIICALGHSNADFDTACRAIDAGASACTHLGNAMSALHHRQPGLVGAALDRPIYTELIADGHHLHPAFIRTVLRAKDPRYIVAISDSMMAATMPDGCYSLGGAPVTVTDGVARLQSAVAQAPGDPSTAATQASGPLAGSILTLDQALRNLMTFTGKPLEEVLPFLTEDPARLLRMEDRLGSLEVGRAADLVILNGDHVVTEVVVAGRPLGLLQP